MTRKQNEKKPHDYFFEGSGDGLLKRRRQTESASSWAVRSEALIISYWNGPLTTLHLHILSYYVNLGMISRIPPESVLD